MPTHRMRPVKASATVPAPAPEVLAFVADTRNDPIWCENVETVELLTAEPIGVGSKFRFHQHLERPSGSRIQFDVDVEITSLTDQSVTWKVEDRFQDRVITFTVDPIDGGSRVTQVTEAAFKRPPGLARWAYPSIARRTFKKQLAKLAEHFASADG